jgi:hypothetical protein
MKQARYGHNLNLMKKYDGRLLIQPQAYFYAHQMDYKSRISI